MSSEDSRLVQVYRMSPEEALIEDREGSGQRRSLSETDRRRRLWKWKVYLTCLLIIIIVIGATVAISCYLIMLDTTSESTKYAVIFDAGSRENRMYIYQWDGSKTDGWNGTPVVDQIGECVLEKPLLSFENSPSMAGPGLERCLTQAMETIPAKRYQWTRVYVAATGGMRLLKERNSNATEAILVSVRSTVRSYPFAFRDDHVRIISEQEEGVFAWMTVNYLNVKFNYMKKPREQSSLLGTVDLGGASMQISFVPDPNELSTMSSSGMTMVRMLGANYSVYSHSYRCYGHEEAYRRFLVQLYTMNATRKADGTVVVHQPCAPRDTSVPRTYDWLFDSTCTKSQHGTSKNLSITFIGTSDPARCATLVPKLFNKTVCPSGQCAFDGVYQPHPKGVFLALSFVVYTYQFYNFTGSSASTTLERLTERVNAFCNKTWSEVLTTPCPDTLKGFLNQFCFHGFYVIELLKALGFNSTTWTDVIATETMGGTTVGWTLGLLLTEIDVMPAVAISIASKFPLPAFVTLICLLTFALIVLLIFFFVACRKRPL